MYIEYIELSQKLRDVSRFHRHDRETEQITTGAFVKSML